MPISSSMLNLLTRNFQILLLRNSTMIRLLIINRFFLGCKPARITGTGVLITRRLWRTTEGINLMILWINSKSLSIGNSMGVPRIYRLVVKTNQLIQRKISEMVLPKISHLIIKNRFRLQSPSFKMLRKHRSRKRWFWGAIKLKLQIPKPNNSKSSRRTTLRKKKYGKRKKNSCNSSCLIKSKKLWRLAND